jgi:hypothetical protein
VCVVRRWRQRYACTAPPPPGRPAAPLVPCLRLCGSAGQHGRGPWDGLGLGESESEVATERRRGNLPIAAM